MSWLLYTVLQRTLGCMLPFGIMVYSEYMPRNGIGQFCFSFFKGPSYCLPQWLYIYIQEFTFLPTVQEGSLFSILSLTFIIIFYIIYLINLFFCPDLSCSIWDLQSFLWHAGYLVLAYGISFPDQGSNLGPLNWEQGVLATGHQGYLSSNYCLYTFMTVILTSVK